MTDQLAPAAPTVLHPNTTAPAPAPFGDIPNVALITLAAGLGYAAAVTDAWAAWLRAASHTALGGGHR